jgi:hypothetical protein
MDERKGERLRGNESRKSQNAGPLAITHHNRHATLDLDVVPAAVSVCICVNATGRDWKLLDENNNTARGEKKEGKTEYFADHTSKERMKPG